MRNNSYYYFFSVTIVIIISLLCWVSFDFNDKINCNGNIYYLRDNEKISIHVNVDSSLDGGFFSVDGYVEKNGKRLTISRNIIFKTVGVKDYTILTVSNIDISMQDEVFRAGMDNSLPDFLTKKGTELGLLINHQNGELIVNSRGLLTFICAK